MDSWLRDPRIAARGFAHRWQSSVATGNGEAAVICGHGELILTLAARCRTIVGIERDPGYLELAKELAAEQNVANIQFYSLQESLDTTTSGGRLVFHIFGTLAEFERNLIQEGTQAGLQAARTRGRKGGRPKSLDEKKVNFLYQLYDERKRSIQELCDILGISKSTL